MTIQIAANELTERFINWELNEESRVLDLGAYDGDLAGRLTEKFHPHVFALEPNPRSFERVKANLASYDKVKVFNVALGLEEGMFTMGVAGHDSGWTFLFDPERIELRAKAKMMRFQDFAEEQELTEIDLCLMNVQGYEFLLLPYLLDSGAFANINQFLIQWRLGISKSLLYGERPGPGIGAYQSLIKRMEETHDQMWNLNETTWQGWRRKTTLTSESAAATLSEPSESSKPSIPDDSLQEPKFPTKRKPGRPKGAKNQSKM